MRWLSTKKSAGVPAPGLDLGVGGGPEGIGAMGVGMCRI